MDFPEISAAATDVIGEPEQVMPTLTLAELYLAQGLPKRAMKVYRDLLQLDPQNQELQRRLYSLKEQIDSDEDRARAEALVRATSWPAGGSYESILSEFLDKVRRRKDVLARRAV